MPSESEMMADLAAADASGDTELAQHIAGQIKAAMTPPAPAAPQHGRWAQAAHGMAQSFPVAGGIAGGTLGSAGGPFGMVAGAGLLAAAGKSLQHSVDTALGYENPSMAEVAADAAKTGAVDAATTGAGGMLMSILAKGGKMLAGPLSKAGTAIGRRVLTGGTTPLSARKQIPPEVIDEAFAQGAFKPGGTTQSASDALNAARQRVGSQDAQLLATMEAQGIAGPDANALAKQLEAEAAQKAARSLGSPEPGMFQGAAQELRTKPVDAQGRLSLGAAEDMKRTLQFEAQKEYDKIARQFTPTGEAKKALASRMRQAVEDEIAAQSAAAPDEAAQFVPLKQQFGRIAQAANIAEEGASRASRRSPVSLTDMMAATAGYGHGGGLKGAGALLASKLARTYGPSTATWALKGTAQGLEGMSPELPWEVGARMGAATGPQMETPSLTALLEELRRRRAMSPALAQGE